MNSIRFKLLDLLEKNTQDGIINEGELLDYCKLLKDIKIEACYYCDEGEVYEGEVHTRTGSDRILACKKCYESACQWCCRNYNCKIRFKSKLSCDLCFVAVLQHSEIFYKKQCEELLIKFKREAIVLYNKEVGYHNWVTV